MASSVIHMAVANEINKVIKKDTHKLLIGSIAPDISKHLGETKVKSHFLDSEDTDIPNIDNFLNKYKDKLDDDFVIGYYIHLYTDYLWFKYFMSEIYNEENNMITKLDGSIVKCNGNMLSIYIYNDYTNMNMKLLDEYNMDLSIFYEEIPYLKNIIDEIPMNEIKTIVDKTSIIIKNSKEHKDFVFNIENIKKFIERSTELILAQLKELIKVLDKNKIPYYSCIKELNIDKNKLYFLQTKEYDNENDNSNVIYTELNGYKFLFMGDSSVTTEEEIMNKYNLSNIDVLKVGHHGSKTSSNKDFINEINPKYSIISVGKNNRYGHPNKEVLDNLKNSKIYRTDQDGSIMFKIKNNKLQIKMCSS